MLGRTLLREKLRLGGEVGSRRWSLQRQLAVLRNRAADWSSPRTKGAEGDVRVRSHHYPSHDSNDMPCWLHPVEGSSSETVVVE